MHQTNPDPKHRDHLIAVLAADAALHAEAAEEKLREVVARFRAKDPLAVVGAFEGVPELVRYLDAVLARLATVARGA